VEGRRRSIINSMLRFDESGNNFQWRYSKEEGLRFGYDEYER
jgi:hypothetical protein